MIHPIERSARQELLEARRWCLADGGAAVAEQFEWAVQRALNLLLLMPKVGRPGYVGSRWPLQRIPYTLVYRGSGETISVIAVAHQGRELGYWWGRESARDQKPSITSGTNPERDDFSISLSNEPSFCKSRRSES